MDRKSAIGTSGWNYPTGRARWNGIFYPPPRGQRRTGFDELRVLRRALRHRRGELDVLRPAAAEVSAGWAERTPAGFEFSVKLYQKFTHPKMFRTRRCNRRQVDGPLLDVLAQVTQPTSTSSAPASIRWRAPASSARCSRSFPPSFKDTPDARDYLAWLLRASRDYPLAVELRHRSWSDADRRHAGAAQRVRRGLGADRRAEVPLLDPAELPAERQGLLLHAAPRPERGAVVAPRQVRGSLQLSVLGDELQEFAETAGAAQSAGEEVVSLHEQPLLGEVGGQRGDAEGSSSDEPIEANTAGARRALSGAARASSSTSPRAFTVTLDDHDRRPAACRRRPCR